MIRKAGTIAIIVLLAGVYCNLALGQGAPPPILEIDFENNVQWYANLCVVCVPYGGWNRPGAEPCRFRLALAKPAAAGKSPSSRGGPE